MATLDPGLFAALANPRMSARFADLGRTLGSTSGLIFDQQKREQKKQEEIELARETIKATQNRDPKLLRRSAQRLLDSGKSPQRALELSNLADQLEQKQDVQTAESNLVNYAQRGGIDPVTGVYRKTVDIKNNPQDKAAFFNLAKLNDIPVDRATSIYSSMTGGGEKNTAQQISNPVFLRDSEGNQFSRREVFNPSTSEVTEVLEPFPGNSSETPVGTVVPFSATTGLSGFDQPALKGRIASEKQWAEAKVAAVTQLPSMMRTKSSIIDALNLLESGELKTGGWKRKVTKGLLAFLGEEPATIGEFEARMGDLVLARLQNFSGAISEGERNFLIDQLANYLRSGESNIARLKVILEDAEGLINDGIILGESSSWEEYNKAIVPNFDFVPEGKRDDAKASFYNRDVTLRQLKEMYSQ
tara:strand:- start:2991 stop:4238 length:1248 start_codon:yes stop_codon:yes gene_type:complete